MEAVTVTPISIDQAITDAAAAEATYNADVSNVASIQAAADAASAPLPAAQAKLVTDAIAYNNKLDVLSVSALAGKVPVPESAASGPTT
jgi:hypothetical protein